MSPTYRLLIGVPGKSNAFEISQKLGLDPSIISNAKSLVTKNDLDFENILKKIHDHKVTIENEKAEILKLSKEQKRLTSELEEAKNSLDEKTSEYINKAKQEARDILLSAKEDANLIIKEMESTKNSSNLNSHRNTLNKKISNLNIEPTFTENKNSSKNTFDTNKIFIGQKVFVKTYNQEGTIASFVSKSNTVLVNVGPMKLKVNISDLESSKIKETKKEKTVSSFNSFSKTRTAQSEINVLGLDSVSCIEVVDKFLDDCVLSSLNFARIVHGKGSRYFTCKCPRISKNTSSS